MADVPLGLFLSGGIDSSAIVAFMLSDASAAVAVTSFSMGFDDGSYNELPYAREVARAVRDQRIASGPVIARRRAAVRPAGRAPRRAVRRRLALPDVPRVAAGAGARQGRADGRRRRRAVRRLRRLSGAGAGGEAGLAWCRTRPCRAGRRGRGARSADREEEGPRQQGQALRRRRRARARAISGTTAG